MKGVGCMADALYTAANSMATHAPTASSSLGTITAGSDVLISNFAGLKNLVDDLASLADAFKTSGFYTPVGMITPFGGSSAPTGWFICDGTAKSRSTYSDLFNVIGTNYGVGDGSTTFNLPDLRGRATIGSGQGSGLTNRTLGGVLGGETLPAHSHSGTTAANNRGHDHGIYVSGSSQGDPNQATAVFGAWQTGAWRGSIIGGESQNHTHTFTTSTEGTGTHGVMQPSLVINYIIKA